MDVTDLSAFESNSFDVVYDKGISLIYFFFASDIERLLAVLDAVLCGIGCRRRLDQMLSEVSRVLKPGGKYIVSTRKSLCVAVMLCLYL